MKRINTIWQICKQKRFLSYSQQKRKTTAEIIKSHATFYTCMNLDFLCFAPCRYTDGNNLLDDDVFCFYFFFDMVQHFKSFFCPRTVLCTENGSFAPIRF